MPSPIRQDHARWKRLKPLQIHLNPLLKGLNLFTTFHLPGRGITPPFHTIYIYTDVHVHVNNNEFQKQINFSLWVILGWLKKKTPRGLRIIYQKLGKKQTKLFSLLFFWSIKKNWHRESFRGVTFARKNPWIQILDSWFTFNEFPAHRSSFPPCGAFSFDPRPQGEVRNGGWFQRLELLLWVSWDFVNMAFG